MINARCLENNLYIYIFFPLHFWPSLAQYGRNVSVNARECTMWRIQCEMPYGVKHADVRIFSALRIGYLQSELAQHEEW